MRPNGVSVARETPRSPFTDVLSCDTRSNSHVTIFLVHLDAQSMLWLQIQRLDRVIGDNRSLHISFCASVADEECYDNLSFDTKILQLFSKDSLYLTLRSSSFRIHRKKQQKTKTAWLFASHHKIKADRMLNGLLFHTVATVS